ncbi:MAG: hypothetical protein ACKO0Z_17340 [Betaproteobacteria bacterium]
MNEWLISEALSSTRQLETRIYKLTDEELARALELETATLRRPTILKRLRRETRRRVRNKQLQP